MSNGSPGNDSISPLASLTHFHRCAKGAEIEESIIGAINPLLAFDTHAWLLGQAWS